MSHTQKHVASHSRVTKLLVAVEVVRCNRGACTKGFSSKSQLKVHLRLHDNNLLHCYFCQWRGTTDRWLNDHVDHHFKLPSTKCSYCDAMFYRTNNRDRHEELYHEIIPDRYKCEICQFKTHNRDSLCKHMKRTHSH